MSDISDAQIERQLFISRCLIFIPYTILVHDYALTIRQEVERYWGTGLTWGTALFYLNRYSALLGTIPVVSEYLLTTNDPSKAPMLVAIMLITRTYALYGRNKIVLAIMLVVTCAAVGFGLAIILSDDSTDTLSPHLQDLGCPSASSRDSNLRTAAAWGGMLVFDVMIFSLTVAKALKYTMRDGNLFSVLVRDGALYFAVMIASNACNIGTYTMGGPLLSGSTTTVTNALSSVLISRLMLNVRDPTIRLPQRNRYTRATTARELPALSLPPDLRTDVMLDSVWIEQSHWMDDGEDPYAPRDG
ncbi:hypothetical protein DFH07DRAFT_947955 [Mycena maculata]|uniref:DUF6533 domain-containing protein n=1 Tax=Mycena maculata TaxID=230809 RepID=A0AAD7KG87_9AGAR|nr:hypothetical protein DFH07DRAFT_947955 [Mycena maculata]